MQKRGYLAGVRDSKLYKREDSELRRKDIISFRDNSSSSISGKNWEICQALSFPL